MGKKRSTFKNIMVTLGCTAFAGAYALGGGYAATVFLGGGDGSKPEWLERVEINVNENASRQYHCPGLCLGKYGCRVGRCERDRAFTGGTES